MLAWFKRIFLNRLFITSKILRSFFRNFVIHLKNQKQESFLSPIFHNLRSKGLQKNVNVNKFFNNFFIRKQCTNNYSGIYEIKENSFTIKNETELHLHFIICYSHYCTLLYFTHIFKKIVWFKILLFHCHFFYHL